MKGEQIVFTHDDLKIYMCGRPLTMMNFNNSRKDAVVVFSKSKGMTYKETNGDSNFSTFIKSVKGVVS